MRKGPANSPQAQMDVAAARKILDKWDIGLDSRENMIWAPWRGHSTTYAKNVLAALERADKIATATPDQVAARKVITDTLKRIATDFINGDNI